MDFRSRPIRSVYAQWDAHWSPEDMVLDRAQDGSASRPRHLQDAILDDVEAKMEPRWHQDRIKINFLSKNARSPPVLEIPIFFLI